MKNADALQARANIFAFLVTKCEIREYPQTDTLTQGYKNSNG